MALICGSIFSVRAIASSSSSRALTCLVRTRSARPSASQLPYSLMVMNVARAVIAPASTEHVLIDDVLPDRLAVERAEDISGGLLAHPVDRFPSNPRNMRRDDDVGGFEPRMPDRRRPLLEHGETGAPAPARNQRLVQSRFVD